MINEYILLFALHFIGDFPLQGTYLANEKKNNLYLLFVHSFIWASCLSVGLYLIGEYKTSFFVYLLGTHFAIDNLKCKGWYGLLSDQYFHFVSIMALMLVCNLK